MAPLIFVNKYKSHLTKKLDLTCARPKAKSPINCLYDYKLMFYSTSCHANGSLFKLNGLHRLHFTDRTLQPIFSSPQNELIMFLLFTTPVGFILHTSWSILSLCGWASQPIALIDIKSCDSYRPCVQDTQMKLCFENTISTKCVQQCITQCVQQ